MTRRLDFTDEQLELLVDRLSPTLQKASDIVDMPPAPSAERFFDLHSSRWAADPLGRRPQTVSEQASLESPYGLRIPCALHE